MFSNVLSCCIRAVCIYALLFSTSSPTWAQSVPEVNDIIKSLAPRANQVAPGRPIDGSSEGRKTPGRPIATQRIVIKERTYVIDMVRQLDLEVFFDYGSDKITSKARPVLDRLGAALVSENLKDFRFLIGGHTDAVGSDDYNLELSERRAISVAKYLAEKFPLDPSHLIPAGFGFRHLKTPEMPKAAINRRVQVSLILD